MQPGTAVIAIVDDDLDFLEIMGSVLEGAGYMVKTFTNPRIALEQMPAFSPSLVITDLMMGKLDAGFMLSRAVKEHPQLCQVPVIIVTAVSSQRGFDFHPQSHEDLAAMHVDAFLEKPVNPKKLLRKVEDILSGRAAAPELKGTS